MKDKILIVGAFSKKIKNGATGGIAFASQSIVASRLSENFDFVKIDSSARKIPPPGIIVRAYDAIKRICLLPFILLTRRPKFAFIFISGGLSVLEKGVMVVLCGLFGVRVTSSFRAGSLLQEANDSKLVLYFIDLIVHRSEKILCQSNSWKGFYQSITGAEQSKFIVQQNWIDVRPYLENKPQIGVIDKDKGVNVLFIGWVDKEKGIWELIYAVEQLINEGYKLNVNVLGGGKEFDEISRYITLNGLYRIHLHGWADLEKKLMFIRESDVFVLPSYVEGFPNAVIEAMASGLPAIVTQVGGLKDIIQNGKNGYVVETGSVFSVKNAIKYAIENPLQTQEVANRGREQVLKDNTIDKAEEVLSLCFS